METIEAMGGWPAIEPDWTPPPFGIETMLGVLRAEFNEPVLMELFVGADDKNSSTNILQLDQVVLALPSRDYYLKKSSEGDLKAYLRYMTNSAHLLGGEPKAILEDMQQVVHFERKLASVSGWVTHILKIRLEA